jgi:hypothetical protein
MEKEYLRKKEEGELDHIMRLCKVKAEKRASDLEWQDIVDICELSVHRDVLRKAVQPKVFGALAIYKELQETRKLVDSLKFMKGVKIKKPRLVISDVHLPFAIEGWLEFIKETHAKFGCHEEIIINGDLFDWHSISFHKTETDAMTANQEYEETLRQVALLKIAFPKAKMTIGNHDHRIARMNKELGIDERFLKSLPELFELPDTWELASEFIIDNVYYRHIGCAGGKDGALNSAIANRMSTVVSHLHANGGVKYATSPNGDSIFGLNTGCLFDENTYAGRYGKFSKAKGTLGCGVVVSDEEAYFVPKIK